MVFRRKPPEEITRRTLTVPLTERTFDQLDRAAALRHTTRTALARGFIVNGVIRALTCEIEEEKLVDLDL